MMAAGLYVSPTEFRSFAEKADPMAGGLAGQIATRLAAGDLSGYFGLLPNPDPVLKQMGKDVTVYRSLLADPLVKGARRRRAAAVTEMERGFDPDQSRKTPARVLKAVETAFARLDIQRIIRDLVDGAFFGYRVGEVMWEPAEGLVLPKDLICKPTEWFGFEPEGGELRFRPISSVQGVPVPARKFVVVGKMRSWENPYGEPDLAACFWPVTFKRGGFKFWMTFTEKYGMPWAVGKLPRSAQPKETAELADQLARMVRDAVAVVPDDSSVELLTVTSATNADMYERFMMFCRSEISIALLGNNQSVELQSNKASATAAQGVEESLRDDDAQMVAAGLNDLARMICEVNFPGVTPPVYRFWEQEQVDEVQAGRDEKLSKAGAKFTPQYFKRAYNLQEGDLDETAVAEPSAAGALSFADPGDDEVPLDQAALDDAIDQLPADAIQAAMKKLLMPALKAITEASTPEEVRQALADAWPEMDASELEELMTRAYFVADLVGRDSAREEAAGDQR
jgi:phage gp29-like protein